MGKMKELLVEERHNSEYRGAHDAMIHGLARPSIEEFIPTEETPCPNCTKSYVLRTHEEEGICKKCGQEFIYIDNNVLRYK